MELLADLFGKYHLATDKGKLLSERATVTSYFVKTFRLNPARLAPKLAHIDLDGLYYLKSTCADIVNRSGTESARKYFYYKIRTEVEKL